MQTTLNQTYVRTTAGQAACVFESSMSKEELQLLLLVNGYTPLMKLAPRDIPTDTVARALSALISLGYVEIARPPSPHIRTLPAMPPSAAHPAAPLS